MTSSGDRIAALDLVRGVAVLGILAINVAGFAAAPSAAYSPVLPQPGSGADMAVWLSSFVVFEGKMRGLFSLLFGASLLLFVERCEQAGREGEALQLRRLGWLALFGYLHYLLLWHGDILLLYAVAGAIALFLRRAPPLALIASGLFLFALWQAWGWTMWQQTLANERAVATGTASAQVAQTYQKTIANYRKSDAEDLQRSLGTASALIAHKGLVDPFYPLRVILFAIGETLSYILIGMGLLASGFFGRAWRRRYLYALAFGGVALGGGMTVAFAIWAQVHDWPEMALRYALNFGLGVSHVLMTLGYAALLVIAAPRLLGTVLGQRLAAAGRMAFSNYLGTSLVMTALFYGWGLGLAGQFGTAMQFGFVVAAWVLMLGWSEPWLARFRQGPLEWLWRSLTEGRRLPLRR